MIGKSEFKSQATKVFQSIRPSATFLTIKYYRNNWGEISDFSLCFHIDYKKSVARAKILLENYVPEVSDAIGKRYNLGDLKQAREELLESYGYSLSGDRNPRDTSSHAYDAIVDADGNVIPGIKLHRDQDVMHLWGFGLHKKIYVPGNYGTDRRAALTIAKDDLRSRSPLGNFRQFHLEPNRFQKIVVERLTVNQHDVVRERSEKLIVKNGWRNEELV